MAKEGFTEGIIVMRQLIEKVSGLEAFKEKHGIKSVGIGLGFSEKENKWYGWSHRAVYGFGIGDKIKEGHMPTKYVGKQAKTIEDCKRFAMAFADEVG